jgi:pimeloyl-ACP methyl ester carboxylesterase
VPGADGLQIHLLEWSEAGTPLVLVHGFGNEAHIWDDFAPVVAPHYHTVAVDLRGHGDSDHDPERRYDYEHHVADLETVTAALGIERLVLVGHSFGGRTSTLFAAKHPERMAGLVIVDIGPEHDPRGTTRIRMEVMQRGDGSFADPAEYERVLAHNFPAGSEGALRRMARHELRQRADGRFERKADPAFMAGRPVVSEQGPPSSKSSTGSAPRSEATRGLASREPSEEEIVAKRLWDALARIPCPTLVVRGAASDILSPEIADRMVDDVLVKGRLAVVPRAAHSVMTDNPAGFAEAVSAFVLG